MRGPLKRILSVCSAHQAHSRWPRSFHVSSALLNKAEEGSKFASFGYQEVPVEEKAKLVGTVFSNVASKYDLMNDLMTGGLHRIWKDRLVELLRPFPGMRHLDVAGGTGDIAFRVLESIRTIQATLGTGEEAGEEDKTRVIVCDINPEMLEVGKRRAEERGLGHSPALEWMEGDAEALALESGSVDGYTIAFGIRNVTHVERALAEAQRVLRPGGRFLCLELSHMADERVQPLYDAYSFAAIPLLGEIVANDRKSYQYLVESIRRFPKQDDFASMIKGAGFSHVEYENLLGGVVAIHSAFKQ